MKKLRDFFRRKPDVPEDPYAYVPAVRKPRFPSSGAVAVADSPDDKGRMD